MFKLTWVVAWCMIYIGTDIPTALFLFGVFFPWIFGWVVGSLFILGVYMALKYEDWEAAKEGNDQP